MDIMDIQAVESKLSDVTVTPIPRSQVQNFYNYQQQREQRDFKREQQPQIQISAIHHAPRERSNNTNNNNSNNNNNNSNNNNCHNTSNTNVSELLLNSINAGGTRDLYITTNNNHNNNNKRSSNNSTSLGDFQQQNSATTSAAAAIAALQYTQQLQAQLALLQQQANTTASPTTNSRSSNNSSSTLNLVTSNNNNNNNNNSGSTSMLKYPQSVSPLSLTSAVVNLSSLSGGNGGGVSNANGVSKYAQLLSIIEEMGREIRPTYTGSRSSTERLKRAIVTARILVRECLVETERSARQ